MWCDHIRLQNSWLTIDWNFCIFSLSLCSGFVADDFSGLPISCVGLHPSGPGGSFKAPQLNTDRPRFVSFKVLLRSRPFWKGGAVLRWLNYSIVFLQKMRRFCTDWTVVLLFAFSCDRVWLTRNLWVVRLTFLWKPLPHASSLGLAERSRIAFFCPLDAETATSITNYPSCLLISLLWVLWYWVSLRAIFKSESEVRGRYWPIAHRKTCDLSYHVGKSSSKFWVQRFLNT